MNRDKLLLMEDTNFIKKMLSKVMGKKKKDFKTELIKSIALVAKEMKKQGKEDEIMSVINKHHPKKIKKLQDLIVKAKAIKEDIEVDEDPLSEGFKDIFSGEIIKNAYSALSFYPILMVFLELDKIFRGSSGELKIALVYLVMWLAIVSGKSEAQNILTNLYSKTQSKSGKDFKNNPIGFQTA